MNVWNKRLGNLITIKSIITLGLLGLVIYLAIVGEIPADLIVGLFTICMRFYFGTQSNKKVKETEEDNYEDEV